MRREGSAAPITNKLRTTLEEVAQADPPRRRAACRELEPTQLRLEGTDGPAVLLGERLEGRRGLVVQRADIPELHGSTRLVPVEPAKGQSLAPADVGSVLVDAAAAVPVQEGAGALRVGMVDFQQPRVMASDAVGLDLEDGEVVHAAARAAGSASETRGVPSFQFRRPPVDLVVHTGQR